jgi:phospholipid-translocating ATPase
MLPVSSITLLLLVFYIKKILVFTMAPVFSLVYDRDVSQQTALLYPELYKDLKKGRALTLKTFCIWLLISVYQGGAIMILALLLFETEMARIVSISFTSLIANELILIALEVSMWHLYMIWAQLFSIVIYIMSMLLLKDTFGILFLFYVILFYFILF